MKDQPRVPAGSPEGGQFASKGGGFSPGVSGFDYRRGVVYQVGHDEDMTDEDLRKVTGSLLGKELGRDDIMRTAGALPGSRVMTMKYDEETGKIEVTAQLLSKDGGVIGYVDREISLKNRTIYNSNFAVRAEHQGKGIGREVLLTQVRAASAAGFEAIHLKAAGSPDTDAMNGYYTWPRLGFMPSHPMPSMPGGGETLERTVSGMVKLMSTGTGRKWWKENGNSFHGKFDLKPGSISRRILDAYAKEK